MLGKFNRFKQPHYALEQKHSTVDNDSIFLDEGNSVLKIAIDTAMDREVQSGGAGVALAMYLSRYSTRQILYVLAGHYLGHFGYHLLKKKL